MIYCKMRGRLGNQMFRYAFCRWIQIKRGDKEGIHLFFDKSDDQDFDDELKFFNIANYQSSPLFIERKKKKYVFGDKIICRLSKIISDDFSNKTSRLTFKVKAKRGIYRIQEGYKKTYINQKTKNIYVDGLFESEKFFSEIRELLINEFQPKHEKLVKNRHLYDTINNTNAVCISIRRGDFLSDKYKKKHYICDERYFERAISIIKEKVDKPVFILFSDDIEWVKKNVKIDGETHFEDGTDPSWEKLRLMYSCKHFIVSNSTFSWWAQYLGTSSDKVVVGPKKWKNGTKENELVLDSWVKI